MSRDKRTSEDIRKEIKALKKLIQVKNISLMQEELYQIKLQKTFDNAGN
jgi:hypothetical protein